MVFHANDDFETDTPQKSISFFRRKSALIATIFTAVWLAFIVDYFLASHWWANRVSMSPAELAGGIGGLLLPILVAWLISAYFDRSVQLEYEARTLKSYLNELVYPTAEGAVYTKALTDALRSQIKEFREVFGVVSDQTMQVRDDLKQWVEDLSTIISHVDTHTVASVREIAGHIPDLVKATEVANDQAVRAGEMFERQGKNLEEITAQTVEAVQLLSQNLQMNIEELENKAHLIETTNERISNALNQSENVGAMLEKEAFKIEKAVSYYEEDAKNQNARLFKNLEQVLNVFKQQGNVLDGQVSAAVQKLQNSEAMFVANAKSLFQVADQISGQITKSAGVMQTQSEKVKETLGAVKRDMSALQSDLNAAGKVLDKMPKEKGHAYAPQEFLKDASDILDKLQGFSVDMARIFSPKAEEALWQKYYGGDKAVFMRHIAKEISRSKAEKIQRFYHQNPAFKVAVGRYMGAFEAMSAAAGKGKTPLLLSFLIGSDVGRLYMVLADVLKNKEK